MCDQSAEMPGGDSGPDGEEPAVPSTTGEHGGEGRVPLAQHDRGAQSERHRGEESGASGGEVGQEDEEMTSGSHDLSSSANHSPGSTMGSTSASTKSSIHDNIAIPKVIAENWSSGATHMTSQMIKQLENKSNI